MGIEAGFGITAAVTTYGVVTGDIDNDGFRDATTWRATAAYVLPEAGTRFHGSYATGVTNPTFFDLFGFDPGSFAGNPNLEPEKSDGWDVGVEQALFERFAHLCN